MTGYKTLRTLDCLSGPKGDEAMSVKESLTLRPLEAKEPLVGRWLSYLGDGRKRTKEVIENLPISTLDWQGLPPQNSIGTLLYHIALIEADWLYVEILERPYPDMLKIWFPFDVRDNEGRLTPVKGWELSRYLELLDNVRGEFITHLSDMTLEEFSRLRSLEYYDVSPEWVCSHLLQHEAAHRGQILLIREHYQNSGQHQS
jgi:uncharacterized damage-inducible protein DinB